MCHEMNNIVEGPKSQISNVYALMVYNFFWCLVMEKMENPVFASMKTLNNFKDPY
jgi:hypothetical protein